MENSTMVGNIIQKRMTAQIEGDFVIFLIGMRINKPLLVHKWIPAALSMPRMLRELTEKPEPLSKSYLRSY